MEQSDADDELTSASLDLNGTSKVRNPNINAKDPEYAELKVTAPTGATEAVCGETSISECCSSQRQHFSDVHRFHFFLECDVSRSYEHRIFIVDDKRTVAFLTSGGPTQLLIVKERLVRLGTGQIQVFILINYVVRA
ncbi:hypothetical protein chiPu_0015899 [Chiloscyllium punctatum]|uniref:Uncharacterized protein n=1 Tax=Chiloscyllium punctatum TaxID=137246 RepID=A0A401T433_CHIPU|nr:hypothetical protein [Chiloscyllium punctatum]